MSSIIGKVGKLKVHLGKLKVHKIRKIRKRRIIVSPRGGK